MGNRPPRLPHQNDGIKMMPSFVKNDGIRNDGVTMMNQNAGIKNDGIKMMHQNDGIKMMPSLIKMTASF